jgi:hypothetical protein
LGVAGLRRQKERAAEHYADGVLDQVREKQRSAKRDRDATQRPAQREHQIE